MGCVLGGSEREGWYCVLDGLNAQARRLDRGEEVESAVCVAGFGCPLWMFRHSHCTSSPLWPVWVWAYPNHQITFETWLGTNMSNQRQNGLAIIFPIVV